MASLKNCLQKIGLDEHEAAILRGKVSDLRDEGYEAHEAAKKAVTEYLNELQAERSDIAKQLREQGVTEGATEQPKPQPAPEPEVTTVFDDTKRKKGAKLSRSISPNDPIFANIAKLGGISQRDAVAQGIDKADFGRRGFRILKVWTPNGKSFDAMAEALWEQGDTRVVGSDGRYDANKLLELVNDEYAYEGGKKRRFSEKDAESAYQEHMAKTYGQEAEKDAEQPVDTYDAQAPTDVRDQYDQAELGRPEPEDTAEYSYAEPQDAEAIPPANPEPQQAPAVEAAAPQYKTYSVAMHDDVMARTYDGDMTAAELKAAFAALQANKAAVIEELEGMTKAAILGKVGGSFSYRYKNDKKATIVRAAYRDMLSDFALGNSYSYSLGEGSQENALQALVDAQTDESLAALADDIKKAKDDRKQQAAQLAEAIKDPKTLDDFFSYIRAKMADGATSSADARLSLSPEQRAKFDELRAEKTRSERAAKNVERKTEVTAAGSATSGEIIKTKHTRDGYDLFVVQPTERVDRDVYNEWNATAKRLGGHYSSYRAGGAVPGFQFKTMESAEAFKSYIGGDAEQAKGAVEARLEQKAETRAQTASERLREMADRMEAKADESLSADRKQNTHRRARMAASAEAAANNEKAFAKTMRNIADAIDNGTAKFLDKVNQKVQVEMLRNMAKIAHYDYLRKQYPQYADFEKHKDSAPTAESVGDAKYPAFTAYRSDFASLGRELSSRDGTKKLGNAVLKIADDVTDAYLKFAKENVNQVAVFRKASGDLAAFPSKAAAEYAIARSGYKGKAIVLPFKRGENLVVMGPSMATERGVWQGDPDKKIFLPDQLGKDIVDKTKDINKNWSTRLGMAHLLESVAEQQRRLASIGIEHQWEFRAALREFVALNEKAEQPSKIKELERKMIGRRNDGLDFFPTPPSISERMIEAADIKEGMAILEPSAGMGHIADQIREAGFEPDVVELSGDRRELLEAKGYSVVATDFMSMTPISKGGAVNNATDAIHRLYNETGMDVFKDALELVKNQKYKEAAELVREGVGKANDDYLGNSEKDFGNVRRRQRDVVNFEGPDAIDNLLGINKLYDRIIMNPPFSDRRDAEHVQHAYELLRPNGRLVAIMGEGVFFGQDKRAQDFRDWLDSVGGVSEKLDAGTFNDSSLPVNTGANARLVVIDKSAEAKKSAEDQPMFARASSSENIAAINDANRARRYAVDARHVDKATVETVASRLFDRLGLAGRVNLVVHDTEASLPEAIRGQAVADGAQGSIYGVYYRGDVHLIASNLKDEAAIESVVWHEAMGHFGFRQLFGKEATAYANRLYMALGGDKGIKKVAQQYNLNLHDYFVTANGDNAMARDPSWRMAYLVDELLAHVQQTNTKASLPERIVREVKAFVGSIRNWLRKMGFENLMKFSDSDLMYLLHRMALAAKGWKGSAPNISGGEPRFLKVLERNGESVSSDKDFTISDSMYRNPIAANGIDDSPMFSRATTADETTEQPTAATKQQKGWYKQKAKAIIDYIDTKLDPIYGLENRYAYWQRRGLTQGEIANSQEAARTFYEAFKDLSMDTAEKLYNFFTTKGAKVSDVGLDADKAKLAVEAKQMIKDAGRAAMDAGILKSLPYEDQYLPRVYLKYLLGEESTQGGGKKTSDQGYGKKRKSEKELPEVVRKIVLGEIKDPAYLVTRAITLPSRDAALFRWYEDIANHSEWTIPEQFIEWQLPFSDLTKGYKASELSSLAAAVDTWADNQTDASLKADGKRRADAIREKAKEARDLGKVTWDPSTVFPQLKAKPRKVSSFWLLSEARDLRERAQHYPKVEDREAAMKVADAMELAAIPLKQQYGDRVPDGFERMPDTNRYGMLRGMLVRKEIYEDIIGVGQMVAQKPSLPERILGYGSTGTRITQAWKGIKVAMNPPAQARNFISNMVLNDLGGMSLTKQIKYLYAFARDARGVKVAFNLMKANGLTVGTYSNEELFKVERELREILQKHDKLSPLRKGAGVFWDLMDWSGSKYQAIETLHKGARFMYEMNENGRTAAEAAHIANHYLFDYSEVPRAVRYLRNAPIGSPFLTFQVKVFPRLVEAMLLRPWKIGKYAAIMSALPALIAQMWDVDDDDVEALKMSLPTWLRESSTPVLLPVKDANGRWTGFDAGYLFPWTMYWAGARAAARGDAGEAAMNFAGNFFSGPIADIGVAIKTNKDPFTGKPIINKADPPQRQFASILTYLYGMAMPPWLVGFETFGAEPTYKGALKHIYDSMNGAVDRHGEPTATPAAAIWRMLGINLYPINPELSRADNMRRMKMEMQDTKQRLQQILRTNPNLSPDERRELMIEYRLQYQKQREQMAKYAAESRINPKLLH